MKNVEKAHVAAVPYPALGHSIPFLDLAMLLASHGLTVSYITTAVNIPRLQQTILEAVNNGLDIRLVILPTPPVEGLPQGYKNTDLLPLRSGRLINEMADKLQQPFNCWIEGQLQDQSPPVCVIHDLFIKWAPETANRYKIASFLFNSVGAFAMSMLHSVSGSILENDLQKEGNSVVVRLNQMHPLKFQRHEVGVDFFNPDPCNPIAQFFLRQYQSIGQDCGMLINTFRELEPDYIQHLENVTDKPVWAVGPLLPPSFNGGQTRVKSRGKMADISEKELLRWLDSQTPRSVVYVSFGSNTSLSEQQTNALATCLEASEQPFVWPVKVSPRIEPATSDSEGRYLPEGFLERTKNRGLVIWGWAPQLVILSHPSVGAFMSHCG
ncbi:hypothetical protein KI387_027531 [Taxus chinensis]|uniref:Glycosyltransferase N-terminal domain-containing protein n=1 Tax=Taxus chinensis TaxID=29808 RepID=A0AA38FXR0_TAXCH|nr:hypothetical protein KI387_027531 [Taxus chinensis]